MNVVHTPAYGAPGVLQITTAADPVPTDGEILVRVHASPVTAGDRRVRAADFPGATAWIGRLAIGLDGPRHPVQGTMFAGRVIAVGPSVTRFTVGDDVFGSADHGAYAELICVREDGPVATIPESSSYEEAASIPYGAGTALHFLRDLAKVQPGEKVLILGASGGVGRYAIQIAKHMGAEVTAVCSRAATTLVDELGADHMLDYKSMDFTANGHRYDVVFDIADASSFRHSRGSLTPTGRYLTLYLSASALLSVALTALIGGRRALFAVVLGERQRTEDLRALLADRTIRAVILDRYPMARAADAHRLAEQGVHGEVVIVPTPPEPLELVVAS
ncbi:MAG: NAD(P)-dependent alcohol dehydrogenase [Proteobacteria bacterium]|nr:NAD(P)-dependent alcohol dehydrogenase [Pseudomonadota bacterium]MCP4922186.1 NAD(P)-dependent alcohol dehydrogenase [Pseudomonadota bacterium]